MHIHVPLWSDFFHYCFKPWEFCCQTKNTKTRTKQCTKRKQQVEQMPVVFDSTGCLQYSCISEDCLHHSVHFVKVIFLITIWKWEANKEKAGKQTLETPFPDTWGLSLVLTQITNYRGDCITWSLSIHWFFFPRVRQRGYLPFKVC